MKQQLDEQGYCIIENIFDTEAVARMAALIEHTEGTTASFRKTRELFAIRRFLQEMPGMKKLIFTPAMRSLIQQYGGDDYFISKSIYFDKPELSNWFVAYHQDLTISVAEKKETIGYGPWSRKDGYFAVQPPLPVLEHNFTIRIHLDDTDEQNGALKVVPGSHRKGIYRPEASDWSREKEETCCVPAGGIMLMKPLLLHASARSESTKRRRVMHIEFSNATLPASLSWSERSVIL